MKIKDVRLILERHSKTFEKLAAYESLEQINAVQHSVILDLQEKNKTLQEKVDHLEKMLLSTVGLRLDFTK
jgi:hypothetical protein